MGPKEIKYPLKDLKSARKALRKGLGGKRITFKSSEEMICYFKKITKKK